MWLSVVFYGILGLTVLKLTALCDVSGKEYIEALLPVTRNQYWYFTAYTSVFLLRPILNRVVDTLTEEKARKCCFLFGGLSLCATLAQNIGGDPFFLKEGYSAVWLTILYVLGAVIRKYEWHRKVSRHEGKMCMLLLCCVGFHTLWKYGFGFITETILGFPWGEQMFVDYVSPTVVLQAVCMLCLFANMGIREKSQKVIEFFAPTTFGVYLIHMQPVVVKTLIEGQFSWIAQYPFIVSPLLVIGISMCILLGAMLLEKTRLWIWDLLGIKKHLSGIERMIREKHLFCRNVKGEM